ncbi:MAG TPA: xanthine dehydrogenase family protein subunit M [Clostridia bacterium]|nr:xanthine dehydrogenase family protein subunit M [Clostridia bacterium]
MRFEKYFEPTTIAECCQILKEYGSDAKILAGGTDIVPRLKNKALSPKAIIGIWNIPQINKIVVSSDGLELGASARLRDISLEKSLENDYKVIMEAAGNVSSMQIRNIATIGGNACNASPSADAIQGLMVMDAKVVIASDNGTREVSIENFFTGPGTTILKKDEMLLSFKVPAPKPGTGAVYKKYAIRGDTDISIVGVACRLSLHANGTIEEARISLAAVAPKPIRVMAVENMLIGNKLTAELIEEAAEIVANSCSPINDQRATAEYRKEMIRVWTCHALKEAEERAKDKQNKK